MLKEYLRIFIRRLRFRSFNFSEKVLSYVQKKNYTDCHSINIDEDKKNYLQEIDNLKNELNDFLNENHVPFSVIIDLKSMLELYSGIIYSNNSFDNCNCNSLYDVLLVILESFKRNKYGKAESQLILVMQLYGLSRGNPLRGMENFKSNAAWKNGSIAGYPFIILMDSLRTYRLTKKSRLAYLYLNSCDYKIVLADCAYNYLLNKNIDSALNLFKFLLKKIFNNTELEDIWFESFKSVGELFCCSIPERKEIYGLDKNSVEEDQGIRKICISGMGWSGSGALFDYFKEFKNIKPIEGEFQHLSGVSSLKTVRDSAGNSGLFRKEVLKFFGLTLFGFSKYSSYQEYRTLLIANRFTLSENRHIYAEGMNRLCRLLVSSYLNDSLDDNKFNKLINITLSSIANVDPDFNKNSIFMFDNIIKLYRVREIDYIDNATIFCTYRDPRSNYVALYNENLKFKQNVNDYIKEYRSKRKKAEMELALVRNKNSVINVQFEEFVTDEDYRNKLAERIGCNLSEQNKYTCFQPWISQKNIFNYKDFHDQDAISLIEKELADYLWEK